jgi:hypothetical protein
MVALWQVLQMGKARWKMSGSWRLRPEQPEGRFDDAD